MQLSKQELVRKFITVAFSLGFIASASASLSEIEELTERAKQGEGEAQLALGVKYEKGWGVRQDYKKGAYWILKAANNELAGAQFLASGLYMSGYGVEQDHNKSIYWMRRSANNNYAAAQIQMGSLSYYRKDFGPNHKTIAKEWYGKACDNGEQYGCDRYRELKLDGY